MRFRDPNDVGVANLKVSPRLSMEHAYQKSQAVGHANLIIERIIACVLSALSRDATGLIAHPVSSFLWIICP